MKNDHKEVPLGGHGVVNYFFVDLPLAHDSDAVDDGGWSCSAYPNIHSSHSVGENNVQYGIQDASACHDAVVSEVSEHLKSKSTESEVQVIMNFESQDNDLFDRNFGNLSTTLKVSISNLLPITLDHRPQALS